MNHFLSKILGCDGDCPWRVIYTGDRAVSALDKAVGDAKYFGRIYAFMILGLQVHYCILRVFFFLACCSPVAAPIVVRLVWQRLLRYLKTSRSFTKPFIDSADWTKGLCSTYVQKLSVIAFFQAILTTMERFFSLSFFSFAFSKKSFSFNFLFLFLCWSFPFRFFSFPFLVLSFPFVSFDFYCLARDQTIDSTETEKETFQKKGNERTRKGKEKK